MTQSRLRALIATAASAVGVGVLLIGPGGSLALDTTSTLQQVTQAVTGNSVQAAEPPASAEVQGTNPHGQGTVLSVTLAGQEAVVVGRSRGEQTKDGYHGHNTVLGLFGNDVIGNDTKPGETAKGPIAPIQEQLLDAICSGSGGNICVDALRADSATTSNSSTNHTKVAGVTLGGKDSGIDLLAADSNGNIKGEGDCQVAHGDVTLLKLVAGGNPILDIGQSATDSKACPDGTTTTNSSNPLISIGGQEVPLPGCGANDPGALIDASPIIKIVCNAGSQAGAGNIANDALGGTILQNGDTVVGNIVGAGTGAAALPPAQQPSQAVLGAREAAPKKAANAGKKASKKASKKKGAPASAKKARKAKASKKLAYTGTDVLVSLFVAFSLLALGLALRELGRALPSQRRA